MKVLCRFALLLSLVACSNDSDATAPPNALVGRFGGRGVEIVAGSRAVTVRFTCSRATFPGALIADAEGSFRLGPALVREFAATVAVAVAGRQAGETLTFRVTSLRATGEPYSEDFTATDGAPSDFSAIACLAGT